VTASDVVVARPRDYFSRAFSPEVFSRRAFAHQA
jgi:hypothetical protein